MGEPQRSYSLDKGKIKFLLLEGIHPLARDTLAEAGYENVELLPGALSGDALAEALAGVHFLGIRSRTQLDADALAAADRLTAVGCFCIGTNQVDLDAAQRLGIPVFNAPYSNTRSVAELAIAEIIMLMRGIPQRNAAAHRGEWLKSATGSREIRGKTLGIIGYGHIGSQLGVLAEAMGMRVIYHDIEPKLPLGNAEPRERAADVWGEADVVSLHVPETPETRMMVNARVLAGMREGAFLINLSRGTVVDIDALRAALDSGRVAGAAIDVFPVEPKAVGQEFVSPLRGLDNVLISPHIGGSTLEAQQNIGIEVARKLTRYSDNGSTLSAVNFPQVALPDHADAHRVLHIHHNEPGVMQHINAVFSGHDVNIAAQYLQTTATTGYVVMDIEMDDPSPLLEDLRAVPGTVRARILY